MNHVAPALEPERRDERQRVGPLLDLECGVCGYAAACAALPERCPMCQGEGAWVHAPWRPFSRAGALPRG
jgi:rubrerythrin